MLGVLFALFCKGFLVVFFLKKWQSGKCFHMLHYGKFEM